MYKNVSQIRTLQPVFKKKKKKRNVPFASMEKINEELERFVKTGIKVKFSQWATLIVYVKKKLKINQHLC